MIKFDSQIHKNLMEMRTSAEYADDEETMRAIDRLLKAFGDHAIWDEMKSNA